MPKGRKTGYSIHSSDLHACTQKTGRTQRDHGGYTHSRIGQSLSDSTQLARSISRTDCYRQAATPLTSLHLFDDSIRTLVFTGQPHAAFPNTEYIVIDFQQNILPQIMQHLYAQGLQSLLVEGGSYLLQSFINAELWDEIFVEESPLKLFSGVKAPEIGNKIPYVNEQYFGRNFRHYIATRLG